MALSTFEAIAQGSPRTISPLNTRLAELQSIVNNIETINLAADCVNGSKIDDRSVDSEHIVTGSVDNEHLASGIDAGKLTTGTLPIARIADSAITQAKMADNSVGTAQLRGQNVTTQKIANDAITDVKILNSAVTKEKVDVTSGTQTFTNASGWGNSTLYHCTRAGITTMTLYITRNGSTITPDSSGNITDHLLGRLPSFMYPQIVFYSCAGGTARTVGFSVATTGHIYIHTSSGPIADNGQIILSATYNTTAA